MTLGLLTQWWNQVFLIPFCFGFLLLLMQAVGLVGKDFDLELEQEAHLELDADAGVDLDGDADLDLGGDADLDADLDFQVDTGLEADAEVDADADLGAEGAEDLPGEARLGLPAEAEGSTDIEVVPETRVQRRVGLGTRALLLVGVGRAPLTVILMNLCFSWGFYGCALNSWLAPWLGDPARFFPVSLVGTAIASVLTTGVVSRWIGTYLPTLSTFSTRRVEVVGRVGRTLYSVRADRGGTVRVDDQHGNLQQYSAYLAPGAADIPGDTAVLLLQYDEKRGAFEVEVAPEELSS